MEFNHVPVLLHETIDLLCIKPDGVYIDGTAGGAGHSSEIAKRLSGGRLVAIDKDPDAVAIASDRLSRYPCAQVVKSDFSRIRDVANDLGIDKVDGVLLDLGVSSHQLDCGERGFSYQVDAPLDMRMSQEGRSAFDVVNEDSAEELTRILRDYGEEKFAARIAKNIVASRKQAPIRTTLELVEIVKASIPAPARREGGHPAKRTFQAIRIEVNHELDILSDALDDAFDLLKPGGRLAVITFHSLEDRIVKQAFLSYAKGCICPPDFPVCVCGRKPRGTIITKKPVVAGGNELDENNRSHSAKLRVIEKK